MCDVSITITVRVHTHTHTYTKSRFIGIRECRIKRIIRALRIIGSKYSRRAIKSCHPPARVRCGVMTAIYTSTWRPNPRTSRRLLVCVFFYHWCSGVWHTHRADNGTRGRRISNNFSCAYIHARHNNDPSRTLNEKLLQCLPHGCCSIF